MLQLWADRKEFGESGLHENRYDVPARRSVATALTRAPGEGLVRRTGSGGGAWVRPRRSDAAGEIQQLTRPRRRTRTGGSRDVHFQETTASGDFPVISEGRKIKKQDGKPIANTEDPDLAADVAERLNDDEARREEDKWSA